MSDARLTVQDWVAKAEMDYKAALDLASRKRDPLPDKVVYDCAQCIEKYLKAFLILHQKPFRFRHDLVDLKRRCQDVDSQFVAIENDAILLNRWGSEVRYPGISAATDDAKDAIAAMNRVRKFVRKKLGLKS
jgi:HEPN domain-containing protein